MKPKRPITWFYLCLFVYFMNMAGFVGNLVHGYQWAQYNMWTGDYIYINPYLQRQFQFEGYLASTLLVFSSLCFISIVHFIPRINGSWKRRFTFLFLLALCILSSNCWLALYCYKNKMYPFKFYFDIFELIQWFKATMYEYTGTSLTYKSAYNYLI